MCQKWYPILYQVTGLEPAHLQWSGQKNWTGLQLSDVLWRGFWDSGYILIYCNIAASGLAYIICMTAKGAAQCLMESADISVKP